MSATTTQIVELAKRGFDARQIAEALNLREEDVLAVITQDTAAVKAIKENGLEGQFKGLEQAALENLKFLMNAADNEQVRLKAALYVLDQRQGRLKPRERETIQNNMIYILDRVAAAKDKRKEIDITSQVIPMEALAQ